MGGWGPGCGLWVENRGGGVCSPGWVDVAHAAFCWRRLNRRAGWGGGVASQVGWTATALCGRERVRVRGGALGAVGGEVWRWRPRRDGGDHVHVRTGRELRWCGFRDRREKREQDLLHYPDYRVCLA